MLNLKESKEYSDQPAVLKVIGVGGGGGNAVNRMIQKKLSGVSFVAANTDSQWLRSCCKADQKIQLGVKSSKGLGAGGIPHGGEVAANDALDEIKDALHGVDLLFITAGMGGGTGTGAAPVIARVAREMNILSVAVVTRPFEFEGDKRQEQASVGIQNLRKFADTLLIIPNDKIFSLMDAHTPWEECFCNVDDVLRKAVQSISDVITRPQEINMDFANIKELLHNSGEALMGIGEESGENRAISAIHKAIENPLLEHVSIKGSKGILVNVTGYPHSVTMEEYKEIMNYVRGSISKNAIVFGGLGSDLSLKDKIRVTVISTAFPSRYTYPFKRQDIPDVKHYMNKTYKMYNYKQPIKSIFDVLKLKKPAIFRRRNIF